MFWALQAPAGKPCLPAAACVSPPHGVFLLGRGGRVFHTPCPGEKPGALDQKETKNTASGLGPIPPGFATLPAERRAAMRPARGVTAERTAKRAAEGRHSPCRTATRAEGDVAEDDGRRSLTPVLREWPVLNGRTGSCGNGLRPRIGGGPGTDAQMVASNTWTFPSCSMVKMSPPSSRSCPIPS